MTFAQEYDCRSCSDINLKYLLTGLRRLFEKQLIKRLSATPVLGAQEDIHRSTTPLDSQAALQANKATFFFQLVSQIYLMLLLRHSCRIIRPKRLLLIRNPVQIR